MRGLYVHIPFCVNKCAYCDFYSLPDRTESLEDYVQALLTEAHKYEGLSFETMYFGGGTPSLLGVNNLKSLVKGLRKYFTFSSSPIVGEDTGEAGIVEATIEVNPESANREFLLAALECGFNRLSIGVQSLNDLELTAVGRVHNSGQAIGAIKLAKAAGFKNISADLIIGLPGQTWRSLKHSITRLLALKLTHLSVYCLSLENDTPLAESPPTDLPSEDTQADLFEKTRGFLQSKGYVHYEISNFALPGFECQHNLNYWWEGEYLGLGPAAASHLETIRFKNKLNLDSYLKKPFAQTIEVEQLDIKHKAEEETILRLRLLKEGVNIKNLQTKYGIIFTTEIKERLLSLSETGELTRQGNVFRLHPARILTSNPIFASILTED